MLILHLRHVLLHFRRKCSEKVLQLRQSLVASDAQVESSPVIDLDSLFTSGSELDECVKKLQELKAHTVSLFFLLQLLKV